MITPAIVCATLATNPWTYAGFVADPPAPPPSSPATNPAAPTNPPDPAANPAAPTNPPDPAANPAAPAVTPPSPPAAPPPATASRYRLADASGQVWEHPDPATLRAFVDDRNRQLFPPSPLAPAAAPAWPENLAPTWTVPKTRKARF